MRKDKHLFLALFTTAILPTILLIHPDSSGDKICGAILASMIYPVIMAIAIGNYIAYFHKEETI
jgi:hypothetical protein